MKEEEKQVDCSEHCNGCNGKGSEESHSCPYESDINNNPDENYCNCCDNCQQECCDDI